MRPVEGKLQRERERKGERELKTETGKQFVGKTVVQCHFVGSRSYHVAEYAIQYMHCPARVMLSIVTLCGGECIFPVFPSHLLRIDAVGLTWLEIFRHG